MERCFAPLLQWVRNWWVPTGGRELVLAADPTSQRVFPKGFHAGASRRSMSWIMAMWIHASVVAHKAS